jgi:hypothetical protein
MARCISCRGYYNIIYSCKKCNISFCDICSILNLSPIGNQQYMSENMRYCKNCLTGCLPNISYHIIWPTIDIIQWLNGKLSINTIYNAKNNHNILCNFPVDSLVNQFTDLSIKNKVINLIDQDDQQYQYDQQQFYDNLRPDSP